MLQGDVNCLAKMEVVVGIRGSPSQDVLIEEHSRAVLITLDFGRVQDVHARMVWDRKWKFRDVHNFPSIEDVGSSTITLSVSEKCMKDVS